MSQIPKPPTLPKPKALSPINDACRAEHEALLRRLWRNLDGIIAVLYSADSAAFEEQVAGRVDNYLARRTRAAEHAHELASSYGDDRRAAVMAALATRLAPNDATSVPPLPSAIAKARIATRTLEESLIEWKTSAGNTKRIEVGFVDIACQVSIPDRVELSANLPRFLNDGTREAMLGSIFARRPDTLSVDEIGATLQAPSWITEDKHRSVWIDVRVTTPALGQLVRELKTLRGYGVGSVDVLVVLPSVDEETKEILLDEHFVALDAEWLTEHNFA